MPTAQDPSYASPVTSGQLRRSRYLSEALKAMGERSKDVYSTALGTNASILEDAILNFARDKADRAADEGLKADRVKLADAVLGNLPDTPSAAQRGATVQQQLGAAQPYDLTPAAMDKRNTTGGLQTQARGIFDATGDIGTALQFGLGQQRQAIEDARYEQERKDKLGRPVVAPAGSHGFVPGEDGAWNDVFNVPDPSASSPGSVLQSTEILKDGSILKTYRNGRQEISKAEDGQPYTARDSLFTVDAGGVPMVGSRYGNGGLQAVASPEQIGANKSTIQSVVDTGKAQTEAKISLPAAIASADYSLSVMDKLAAHEGFPKRYGWEGAPGTVGIMEPGSPAADAQALIDQVTGQAFLEAISAMKGSGSVSEREGAAATAAITRLKDNRQSPKAAAEALQELRTRVDNLRLLAQVKAGAPIDLSKLSPQQLDLVEQMLEAAR